MENEEIKGFKVIKQPSGDVIIDGFCKYPQEKTKCLNLYNRIQKINLEFKGIKFPNKMRFWEEIVVPNDDTLQKYYSLNGILEIIQMNENRIKEGETFVKPELRKVKESDIPYLIVRFYQFSEKGTIEVSSIEEVIRKSYVPYLQNPLSTRVLTKLRKSKVKIEQLRHIPILPLMFLEIKDNRVEPLDHIVKITQELTKDK